MDITSSVKAYFSKMLQLPKAGMKIMVLDDETLSILSVSLSFSEIMNQEVFLVDRIKSSRDPLKHLIGVFFLRPTAENISLLSQELRNPRYASYYIFFSHALSKQSLKQLAEADTLEVVAEVHEFFADFLALSPHLFAIDRPISFDINREILPEVLTRCTNAITAVLLSLRRLPYIRFQNTSGACRCLAESLKSLISREAILFDFRKTDPSPVVLIIDRRQDPVTPLLTQWTYEAMIHELIGIKDNRVVLPSPKNSSQSISEITLSREFDDFFKSNQYMNFGEIGQSIKKLVDNFQKATKSVNTESVSSLADLKGLLENYPAFRKASGTVEMHVTLVSELSRIVKERSLMELSEIEQELVCQDNHSSIFQRIKLILTESRINNDDAIRLILLYVLRYESNEVEISMLTSALLNRGLSKEDLSIVKRIVEYAGNQQRGEHFDIFHSVKPNSLQSGSNVIVSNATNTVASLTRRLVKGRKNVENVYTQHEPVVIDILKDLLKGQLKHSSFPALECMENSITNTTASLPKEVIVFFIGGATYEESFAIHKLESSSGVNILLGSTFMHNSHSFLDEVRAVDKQMELIPEPTLKRGGFPITLGFNRLSRAGAKSKHYTLLE